MTLAVEMHSGTPVETHLISWLGFIAGKCLPLFVTFPWKNALGDATDTRVGFLSFSQFNALKDRSLEKLVGHIAGLVKSERSWYQNSL